MAISYTTNWMGPVNYDWVKKNGEGWAVGRIDIYGTGEPYPDEMDLPMMKIQDWGRFQDWLDTVKTDDVWTLEQLVAEYEKTNPTIEWFEG